MLFTYIYVERGYISVSKFVSPVLRSCWIFSPRYLTIHHRSKPTSTTTPTTRRKKEKKNGDDSTPLPNSIIS